MAVYTEKVFGVVVLLAATVAIARTPHVERATGSPVTTISADEIQSLPSRNLDISLLARNGGAIPIHVVTGQDGRLPVEVVPRGKWRADSAFIDGKLFLPDNSFGVIHAPIGPSASDLASIEVLRKPFGVQYGELVAPMRYVSRVVDPFLLLCRGDEGAPTRLNTGERFTFDVPFSDKIGVGGQGLSAGLGMGYASTVSPYLTYRDEALSQLRSGPLGTLSGGASSVWNPGTFPLPDNLGFNMGIDAGADPQKTRGILADLNLNGALGSFEKDPCWKYYPDASSAAPGNGCNPGGRSFEQKAVRYSDSISASLRDTYTAMPVSDAWILFGPPPPTPFFDPGEQPGDELPPTFTRTGTDGSYRIPLSGLSGPLEIQVARGCDSHTTVAIADTPGVSADGAPSPGTRRRGSGTSASPSTPTSAGTATSSAPEEKPPEGMKVCGPDITDHVLGTLQFMVETFSQWDEATKDAKCSSLYGLQADGAWEMRHMGPFDSDRGKDPYLYFARYFPDRCAVPRWPCGATVQFLGVCLDAQIVNYVAWGAMNQLCDNQGIGMLAHLARDRLVNFVRGIKNKSLNLGKGAAYDAQDAMSAVGELFVKEHTGLADRKSLLEQLVKVYVRDYPDIAKTEGFDCQLDCGKYAADSGKMDNFDWGFNWGQEWYDRRGSALSKP